MKRLALAFGALVLLALLVAPLSTPFWWDEGAVYAPGAKWLLDHGFDARPGVFPSDLSRGHTPLFYLLLAGAFRLLGAGPFAGHLLSLGFGWMTVLYVESLGRRLFGWKAGAIAAALLLFTPLFLTMSSAALPEIALAALTAASFHALACGRIVECTLWGTFLVLIKETGVACPLAIAGAIVIEGIRARMYRAALQRASVALVPLAALGAFFVAQKRAEGWFILPYHAGLFDEPHAILEQLAHVGASVTLDGGRFVAVLAAIGLVVWRRRSGFGPLELSQREVLAAFGLHALMNLGFFAKMFFLERYVLPVHVGVVVVLGGLLARERWVGVGATLLSIGVALSRRSAGTGMASGETSFRYLHAVHAYSALYAKLDAASDLVVLTDWPVTDELRAPFLGWVHRPWRCINVAYLGEERVDVVIAVQGLGSYEPLRSKARERGFTRKERIEEDSAAIELWAR